MHEPAETRRRVDTRGDPFPVVFLKISTGLLQHHLSGVVLCRRDWESFDAGLIAGNHPGRAGTGAMSARLFAVFAIVIRSSLQEGPAEKEQKETKKELNTQKKKKKKKGS